MGPCANANVAGSANAIASVIVVSFMACSFSLDSENMGSLFARSIKISVSAVAKLFTARRGAARLRIHIGSCVSAINRYLDRVFEGV